MFTGESGGCGSFFVYRFDKTRTSVITVNVDETALGPSIQPVNMNFDSETKSVVVEVVQFRDPVIDYFCDDVAGDPPPIVEWKALAGNISVERIIALPPKEFASATHKVSVTLTNVQLKNKKTGVTVTLDEVWIKDVWVGWLAG